MGLHQHEVALGGGPSRPVFCGNPKLWVTEGDEGLVPSRWFRSGTVGRAEGTVTEPITETLSHGRLGVEWEWEESPEVTLTTVDSVEQAVDWFNTLSPKLVVSLIDDDPASQTRFWGTGSPAGWTASSL